MAEPRVTLPVNMTPGAQYPAFAPPMPIQSTDVKPSIPAIEDKRMMVPIMNDDPDNPEEIVRLYAADNVPRSKEQFEKAVDAYRETGTAPPGYMTLRPGTPEHMLMNLYQAGINQPVQKYAGPLGRAVGGILGGAATGATDVQGVPQPSPTGMQAGQGAAETLQGLVSPASNLGMTVGSIAASAVPGLGAVIGPTGRVIQSGKALLTRALTGTLMGGAGANLADVVTGKTPTQSEAIGQFVTAGAGEGFQGVLGAWSSRYLAKGRHAKLLQDVSEEMIGQYPQLRQSPGVLNRLADSEMNLKKMTTRASDGLQGTVDDVTDNFMASLGQMGRMNLTVGEQATMRKYGRDLTRAGKAMLDNIDTTDSANMLKASQDYKDASNSITDLVNNSTVKNVKSKTALKNQTLASLAQHEADLMHVAEGARMLKVMEEAGTGTGWNTNRFIEAIQGRKAAPFELLERVRGITEESMGSTPTATPLQRGAANLVSLIPGKWGSAARKLGLGTPGPGSMYPGQRVNPPRLVQPGAALAGESALRNYFEAED